MSFIITVYTNEGIVMASDSRTTYTTTKRSGEVIEQRIGVQITDTTNKTFLTPSNIGISTCGTSSINQTPISGFIEDFISQRTNSNSTVETISTGLIDYFSNINPALETSFIVAGYDRRTFLQKINRVRIRERGIVSIDTTNAGAVWDGEIDTLTKLIKEVAVKTGTITEGEEEYEYSDLPYYNIGFNFFTLQDAINFAEYAVDVTIKTMQFQDRVKTVGGPIDILVIKPNGAEWITQKKLHA